MDELPTAVKSADRALIVLEHLAEQGRSCTMAQIAVELKIPKSSLHGLLRTMHHRGWLAVDDAYGAIRYRVGAKALTVGASFLVTDDIVRRAAPVLDMLSAELGETVHLGVLDGGEVVYLAKRDARHNLRLVSAVGVRLPAYATALGKVLLADLDEDVLSLRLAGPRRQLTGHTLVDDGALHADLEAARARGYAIDDQESTEGVRCFAVALGDSRPRRYALSCSVPAARLDQEMEDRVVALLRSTVPVFSDPAGLALIS